jgi:hypothetical protein
MNVMGNLCLSGHALPEPINGSRQSTPSKARLRHYVVLLGHGECCVTEKVLSTSHVNRVMYGPKTCRGVPETMQVDAESEGFTGSLLHRDVNGIRPHWDAVMRRPKAGVFIRTPDTAAKSFQVHINPRRQVFRN